MRGNGGVRRLGRQETASGGSEPHRLRRDTTIDCLGSRTFRDKAAKCRLLVWLVGSISGPRNTASPHLKCQRTDQVIDCLEICALREARLGAKIRPAALGTIATPR